jgi:hypothetical protein
VRARAPLLATCGLGAAALAACSPYDPDLGATPYLCATEEPRCPDDYTCMDDGLRPVCVRSGGTAPDGRPDQSGFACAADGLLEPNDATSQAYQTDVGTSVPMRVFGPISICPEGDRDHFQINVSTVNKGIRVVTRWDSGPPITCQLLNSAGTAIANGAAMGTNAMQACVTNLPTGVYYAVAYSEKSLRNNYRIELTIVDNCL